MLQCCLMGMLCLGSMTGAPFVSQEEAERTSPTLVPLSKAIPELDLNRNSWVTRSLIPSPLLPRAADEGDGYAQREARSRDLETFTGGHVVIIASCGAVVLVLLLLLILF